jgi:hypothetical protein
MKTIEFGLNYLYIGAGWLKERVNWLVEPNFGCCHQAFVRVDPTSLGSELSRLRASLLRLAATSRY